MDINAGGFKSTGTYIASHELMSAVNVARALSKPLLIKGEPGTGKTMLAKAIAESLDKFSVQAALVLLDDQSPGRPGYV